jgi:hypothetical protein
MLSCVWAKVYPADISDLDGTWVFNKESLNNNSDFVVEREYIWGRGKSIPNNTLEFEIERKTVLMGAGGFRIKTIKKQEENVISLVMIDVSDENEQWPIEIKFHFENHDTIWIESPQMRGLLQGKEKPWYRLSGPSTLGVINDTRVRFRTLPNLSSGTLLFFNPGDKVEIVGKSEEKQKIGGMEAYWYKVRWEKRLVGWVYGAYINIVK